MTSAKPRQHHSAKRAKTATPEQTGCSAAASAAYSGADGSRSSQCFLSGGQLTIESKNATLAQVLRSVQAKTGASFEIPASANSDRVVAQLGPGQPKDVLAALLNGSKFNYIILGSPEPARFSAEVDSDAAAEWAYH